jgi:hypothetical protein
LNFLTGCGGSVIPAPVSVNVTAHYSDSSTQSTFISAGTIGDNYIAYSVIDCGTQPDCTQYQSPTFVYADVIPVSGTIGECCVSPTPTPTSTLNPTPTPTSHNGIWTVSNYDCGLGTVNDVGINSNFMGSLPLGPSTFPLVSTLGGRRQYPNGVINGLNTIQINHSTNLQGTGNCLAVYIYVNQTSVPDYVDYSLSSSPITIINNVNLLTTDDVWIEVECYVGECP